MKSSRTVRLVISDGNPLTVQIHREGTFESPHSRRSLQELHGWVVTSDEALHRRLATVLPTVSERPLRSEDESGEFTGRWCVSWNSYGEAAGVHTYTLILREDEELSLRALQLGDVELHPYEYREEAANGGLKIRAKLVGPEAEVLRLRAIATEEAVLDVVRFGIQDTPRRMRLDVEEWSEFEDRVKYRIALTEEGSDAEGEDETDDADAPDSGEIARAALVFYANYLERLADTLVARGVLGAEELHAIRKAARREPGVAHHELWRVADVDQV